MLFVDIFLTPSLLGATLPLSLSLNKRVLDDFMGLCFFGRIGLRRKEGVTRIRKSKRGRGGSWNRTGTADATADAYATRHGVQTVGRPATGGVT